MVRGSLSQAAVPQGSTRPRRDRQAAGARTPPPGPDQGRPGQRGRTASKKTLNLDNLEALGARRLAELLLELAAGDAAAKRRLRLELSAEAGPEAIAADIGKRLAALRQARSFVDWQKRPALVRDLDQQRRLILDKVAEDRPDLPLQLLWRFMALAARTRGRWVGEQLHQQLKDERGLDHFEGRSWRGLHPHAPLCRLAFAFLQHLRLGGKKRRPPARARAAAPAEPARRAPRDRGRTDPRAPLLPALPAALRAPPPALKVAA